MRPLLALYVGGMGSREKNFYNALVQRYGFEDAAKEVQDLYLDGKKDEAAAALPAELIDMVALVRAEGPGQERLDVYRDAGVGTLIVDADGVRRRVAHADGPRARGAGSERAGAHPARRLRRPGARVPGDRARARAGRAAATRSRSRPGTAGASTCEREGMRFAPAPEYEVCPTRRPARSSPTQAAVRASAVTRDADPRRSTPTWWSATSSRWPAALAAEIERAARGRRSSPTCLPTGEPGFPPYSVGARLPAHARSARRLWRAFDPLLMRGERAGPRRAQRARARASGCRRSTHVHGGISRELALVATFPQLEYPRTRPGALACG